MKNKYVLFYMRKSDREILHNYFKTEEDMKDFIKVNLSAKRQWKVLFKHEIKKGEE